MAELPEDWDDMTEPEKRSAYLAAAEAAPLDVDDAVIVESILADLLWWADYTALDSDIRFSVDLADTDEEAERRYRLLETLNDPRTRRDWLYAALRSPDTETDEDHHLRTALTAAIQAIEEAPFAHPKLTEAQVMLDAIRVELGGPPYRSPDTETER
jgi:hypothetical protein